MTPLCQAPHSGVNFRRACLQLHRALIRPAGVLSGSARAGCTGNTSALRCGGAPRCARPPRLAGAGASEERPIGDPHPHGGEALQEGPLGSASPGEALPSWSPQTIQECLLRVRQIRAGVHKVVPRLGDLQGPRQDCRQVTPSRQRQPASREIARGLLSTQSWSTSSK